MYKAFSRAANYNAKINYVSKNAIALLNCLLTI